MTECKEPLLCVDVGNTNTRFGIFESGEVRGARMLPTRQLMACPGDFQERLPKDAMKAAFCSVTPAADALVEEILQEITPNPFRLSFSNCGDLPIRYPKPNQVGEDRLANSLAARKIHGTPAIVIDVGTAATFDIVTTKHGYEGGVIVPGPQALLDCLQVQTALLPHVSITQPVPQEQIGRSTTEAMLIGISNGFPGMIEAILAKVIPAVEKLEGGEIRKVATGGGGFRLNNLDMIQDPDLTLKGIALAHQDSAIR